MIRAAIVEDEAVVRERIRDCLAYLEETSDIRFEAEEFPSAEAFIGAEQGYDLVFMDIQLPGMDGMEAARALRRMDSEVVLIFVTNLAQYAISGYEVEAMDFILKPINKYSFAQKVKRAVARMPRRPDESITIRQDGEIYRVPIGDIQYLDMQQHHVIYHTAARDYSEYITLKEAGGKIGRDYFVYCNRSYLVNLHHVRSVNGDTVLVGGASLAISRPQRKAFLSALADYMRGRK